MHELLPIVIGVGVAAIGRAIAPGAVRLAIMAALVVAGAAIASVVNGETAFWPALLGADVFLVFAGAMAGDLALRVLARRWPRASSAAAPGDAAARPAGGD